MLSAMLMLKRVGRAKSYLALRGTEAAMTFAQNRTYCARAHRRDFRCYLYFQAMGNSSGANFR